MGQFNEDIVGRVSRLEETAYYSDEIDDSSDYEKAFFADYDDDQSADSSSDYEEND